MNSKLTALVDADNFYVSCERLFRPELRRRPVAVLSNNDGCVVARSQEVKDFGVKMGTPVYQIRNLIKSRGIHVFSSNYELYGDISNRVMRVLGRFSADREVYSIDEAFFRLRQDQAENLCEQIVSACWDWLSIPVKIGVAPNKTLAKAATEIVKQEKLSKRFLIISRPEEIDEILKKLPLEEVWGIGGRLAGKLKRAGIASPMALKSLPEEYLRHHFGVVTARTAAELRGSVCFDLENQPRPQKNLCYSRSFGQCIDNGPELRQAVTDYATEAAAKLRKQHLKAQSVSVFILTDRFKSEAPQYANSASFTLTPAINDTLPIVRGALKALNRVFRNGYAYKKCGVLLNRLIPEDQTQPDLFIPENPRDKGVSAAMDIVNRRYGAGSLVLAGSGIRNQKWRMTRRCRSARYTTQWSELPQVK